MVNPHEDVVARARELSALDALLGAAPCAVVEGPAGIGTTSLARAFAASRPEAEVLWASATPWERALDGGLLAQLGIVPDGGGTAAGPNLARPPGGGTDSWGPGEPPAWLAAGRACLDRLAALAGRGPVLVVLDALEHADALSLEALAFALRRHPPGLLVLATCGPAGTRPGSAAAVFADAVSARRLRLGPLTVEGLKELAAARYGLDLAAGALNALWRASRGIPELALEAIADGVEEAGEARFAAEGPRGVVRSV
ncbi:ATP-binding protein, partial [Sinomonas atrocyanea]